MTGPATSLPLVSTVPPPTGGASGGAANLFLSLAPWLALLLVVVVVGWFVIVFVRRMLRGGPPQSAGFTLEELRQMHRRGELDDEEFARAKASVVGRARDQNRDERTKGGWEESGRRQGSQE
ncbi:MAG: SHOCT domain-containing protein [Phycisphaerales bacterium]